MESNEPPNPVDVRLLGSNAIASLSQAPAHHLHESESVFRVRLGGEMRLGNEWGRHARSLRAAPAFSFIETTRREASYFSSSFRPALRLSQFSIVLNTRK